jgi:ribosomal protein S18 acetylase RimI-like enzyme
MNNTVAQKTSQHPNSSVKLVPANQYTIEELTTAYNQTRVDYMVPMPMNAARLASYIKIYDVDMDRSWVAVSGDEILGLGMLGVRPGRTWITRLGVLPIRRRRGTGEALTHALMQGTHELGRPLSILEVIKGNTPAHELFLKVGFHETRELLVLRRAPGLPLLSPPGKVTWIEKEEALDLLCAHPTRPAWTNELESFINAGDVQGLNVTLSNGSTGWLVFRRQRFLLSHFVMHTVEGDPQAVALAMIAHLYNRFPQLDTFIENLPTNDPHYPALQKLGFLEVFRRIEMAWEEA